MLSEKVPETFVRRLIWGNGAVVNSWTDGSHERCAQHLFWNYFNNSPAFRSKILGVSKTSVFGDIDNLQDVQFDDLLPTDIDQSVDFTDCAQKQSHPFPSIVLLGYRLIAFCYTLFVMMYSFIEFGFEPHFFTHLSYYLLCFYFLIASIASVFSLCMSFFHPNCTCGQVSKNKYTTIENDKGINTQAEYSITKTEEKPTFPLKAASTAFQLLFIVVFTSAILTTIVFWGFMVPGSYISTEKYDMFTFASLSEHMGNVVVILIEAFLNNIPPPKFRYSGVLSLYMGLYAIITVVYYDLYNDWAYFFIDVNRPFTIFVYIAIMIGIYIVYFIAYGILTFKGKRFIQKRTQRILDKLVEMTNEKTEQIVV